MRIQQRAVPVLSFSMVSLKWLQALTSASGSTDVQGLDTGAMCSKMALWCRSLQIYALFSPTHTSPHSTFIPLSGHVCLREGVWTQISAVAFQTVSLPRDMDSRNKSDAEAQEKAWGKHCLLTPGVGTFYTKYRAWMVMGGTLTVPRSPQFSRKNMEQEWQHFRDHLFQLKWASRAYLSLI